MRTIRQKRLGVRVDPGPKGRLDIVAAALEQQGSSVRVLMAWRGYLEDKWAQNLNPPCPLRAFTGAKVVESSSRAAELKLGGIEPPERGPCAVRSCERKSNLDLFWSPVCESHWQEWRTSGQQAPEWLETQVETLSPVAVELLAMHRAKLKSGEKGSSRAAGPEPSWKAIAAKVTT